MAVTGRRWDGVTWPLAIVCFALAAVLASGAVISAVRATSSSSEEASRQQTVLQDRSSRAAARLAHEVDVVRLAATITAVDTSLRKVADQDGKGSAADITAARRPLEALSKTRAGLISVARLRLVSGREVLRVSDRPISTGLSSGAIGSSWIGQAVQAGVGKVVTTDPHNSTALRADVISTATAIGDGNGVTAVLEIETPVAWLEAVATNDSPAVSMVAPDAASSLQSQAPDGAEAGVSLVGNNIVGWAPTVFDDRIAGPNSAAWVVTVSAVPVATGLDAMPLSAVVLTVLAFLAFSAALASALLALRRRRRELDVQRRANDALQASIADMSVALAAVAEGDLARSLPVDEFDDDVLRGMAGSFDSTLSQLRALVAQAQEHGSALSQASVELRASANGQASAATEQSNVVTETTATIEELAATAAQIAQTAEHVAAAASETLRLTEEGRAAVISSVDAMDGVGSRMSTIGERAVSLGDTGREISRIVDVIDELSERTNMLALNAAIEAARAGEHGQGFAVVAGEVRRLAERARSSTTQIQALVSRISSESGATVIAAEDGQREVDRARGVASEAASALDRIAGMVDETTMATREISIATAQQQSASDQVVVAMGQVSVASQQYAAGSRQAAASAQELSMLAEAIHRSIGSLTVRRTSAEVTDQARPDPDLVASGV